DGPLVIQFDGKLLPSIAGGPGKEDRIAIIVTGRTTEKLLAIPKVVQGTGEQIAKAAAETITDWELTNSIAGMSFDTTAANTGHLNGTCVLLEQKLGKNCYGWLVDTTSLKSYAATFLKRSIKYTGKEELGDKKLDYFIGSRSHFFFEVLNLDKSFLNLPVEQWPQLEAYQHAKVVARSLKVVNDSAERGIALATNFNKSLTKKEDEKQYLYQVVESHCKQYPDAKKATLNQ
ncbi:DNA repair protein RAD51 3, partial [Biomphalaria pfeifferi]